jgi:mannosyl-oligosaccharide alpha-1,2-mannosidase
MDIDKTGSVFELTIRYLGGFLSAYALTKDELYLQKAEDIGSRLVKAFDTSSGIPNALVNLHTGHGEKFGWVRCNCAILSEMGTMQLEFDYLSVITKDPKCVTSRTRRSPLHCGRLFCLPALTVLRIRVLGGTGTFKQ